MNKIIKSMGSHRFHSRYLCFHSSRLGIGPIQIRYSSGSLGTNKIEFPDSTSMAP
uniref:Uncharacterized protein n=1 Tax=Lepeophtheirus salmonis TaxID=72036 RepID=A0A0K2V082_LEPSM